MTVSRALAQVRSRGAKCAVGADVTPREGRNDAHS